MNEADMDVIAEAIAAMVKHEPDCEATARELVKSLTDRYPLL
jgi:glycine/serine hydroxymethyltransferase